MTSINGKQSYESMNERRQLVDEQLVCISEWTLLIKFAEHGVCGFLALGES